MEINRKISNLSKKSGKTLELENIIIKVTKSLQKSCEYSSGSLSFRETFILVDLNNTQ